MHVFLLPILLSILVAPAQAFARCGGTAPYKLNKPVDYSAVGILAGTFVAAVATKGFPAGSEVGTTAVNSREKVPAFDRGATYRWSPAANAASDVGFLLSATAPLTLLFDGESCVDRGVTATLYAETMLSTTVINMAVKEITQRARPFTYNENREIPESSRASPDAHRSFYSGHTSMSFAGSMFLGELFAKQYPHSQYKNAMRVLPLSIAAGVGSLRYFAGKHFPSDILVGAITGTLIGYAVPKLHETSRGASNDGSTSAALAPITLGIQHSL
jgi:membrane-associated phospholipid phosphatase